MTKYLLTNSDFGKADVVNFNMCSRIISENKRKTTSEPYRLGKLISMWSQVESRASGQKGNKWILKIIPFVAPWIVAPALFTLFVNLVHAFNVNSLQQVLLYVVLPVGLWMAFVQCCSGKVYGTAFAPCFIAANVVTIDITYVVKTCNVSPTWLDASFCTANVALGFTFWRMITSDPGYVTSLNSKVHGTLLNAKVHGTPSADVEKGAVEELLRNNNEHTAQADYCPHCKIKRPIRSKHCKYCNVCIRRFDHHCPAIGNCVGLKNHRLFLVLLITFITCELLYTKSSTIYLHSKYIYAYNTALHHKHGNLLNDIGWLWNVAVWVITTEPWVVSTTGFAGMQACWQLPLLGFHLYCASINLTTDEVFHWETRPDLHVEEAQEPGRNLKGKKFMNPYSRGVMHNLSMFCKQEKQPGFFDTF